MEQMGNRDNDNEVCNDYIIYRACKLPAIHRHGTGNRILQKL